jgi:hypothetical protein
VLFADISKGRGTSRISYRQKGVNSDETVLNGEFDVLALFSFCYAAGKEVVGLPLFPVASGEIGIVGNTDLFLTHQADLLPRGKHFFVTPITADCILSILTISRLIFDAIYISTLRITSMGRTKTCSNCAT